MLAESLEETRRAAVCSTAYIARIGRGRCDPAAQTAQDREAIVGRDPFRYGPSLQPPRRRSRSRHSMFWSWRTTSHPSERPRGRTCSAAQTWQASCP